MGRYGSLAAFLLVAILVAAASASFEAGQWYFVQLGKPAWTPPPWVYAIAWAAAYVFAALAAWNVWLTGHYDRLKALLWWLVLLALNVLWSFFYLGMHRPGWAWLTLGVAVVIGIVCIMKFRPLSTQAAGLMSVYLLWIIFLWVLVLATWTLSGGLFARVLL